MTTNVKEMEVSQLEPAAVWKYFSGIAATPRPSKREELIRQHVKTAAQDAGLTVRADAAGNLVVDVPATPGHEAAEITVLQAHLDMVGEKDGGSQHDFDRDPIQLRVEDDAEGGGLVVRASGTTLGADNGIGVAMALAASTSKDVVHGPLELLFTVDEEAGMSGAKALGADSFRGRRMVNLDSEEDDTIYIGCAGGSDSTLSWGLRPQRVDFGSEFVSIDVSGLRGGHSGGDIHENRANAIKLLVRALQHAGVDELRLAALTGGNLRNAIPREASAVVCCAKGAIQLLLKSADKVAREAAIESAEADVSISARAVSIPRNTKPLGTEDSRRVLDVLAAIPHGVLGMHPRLEGLVETSSNLASVTWTARGGGDGVGLVANALSRSSCFSRLRETLDQIAAIGRLSGARVENANDYPGWEPNPDSRLLKSCTAVYEKTFGAPPVVAAIHAGLECGVIGDRVGGLDTVSFGPRIVGAHSPVERVYVKSVQKCWQFLRAVLAELARK